MDIVHSPSFAWGLLFWYPTAAAFIALALQLRYHPWLQFKLPWWFMGLWVGAWMNLLLFLINVEAVVNLVQAFIDTSSHAQAAIWFTLDGAVAGLLIAWIVKRVA